MSPLNRGPLLGPRVPPAGIRPPPPPRFGGRLPPPGLPPRMPPPPINPVFGPIRQRLPPPPRPGGVSRPNGPMPLFAPRVRAMAPMIPPLGLRGAGPRGPLMRPWHRRALPPQILSHMRPRYSIGNGNAKGKASNNVKKVNKLEELELKKPWMTDEIRSEIQKKNKLYAKAKKNKDAKEWEEFKDLRNKVTRMIRDAKNDYLAKHPEQAHLYPSDEEPYDQRDINDISSDDESFYCEICDKEFSSEDALAKHKGEHKLCGIDGCTFSAHPLLVEKHITMQHSTGLYHRIKNLSTPEDIEKWIMERKKRYPTKVNIELRKAEELEKIQRGEVIKEKQEITKHKRKKLLRSRKRKRTVQKQPIEIRDNIQQKETYRGLPEFCGTLNLRNTDLQVESQTNEIIENVNEESINYISDEEEIPAASSQPMATTFNLPNLVANYESSSEESNSPIEVPIEREKLNDSIVQENDIKEAKNEIIHNTQLSMNIKKCSDLPLLVSKNFKTKDKQNIELNRRLKNKEQKCKVTKKQPYTSQLLQKLLSRSIQHERNLICQCVKYIVNNNFFD